jgi:hypothetical protein
MAAGGQGGGAHYVHKLAGGEAQSTAEGDWPSGHLASGTQRNNWQLALSESLCLFGFCSQKKNSKDFGPKPSYKQAKCKVLRIRLAGQQPGFGFGSLGYVLKRLYWE